MFYTAASIAKRENFVLQKHDSIVFFAGCEQDGKAKWTSDKDRAWGFSTIVNAVRKATELNLPKIIVIRELYQVVEVEIDAPVVINEEHKQL